MYGQYFSQVMKVAVLIPCYNESLSIAKVIADFQAELPEAKIYVYDNNSTDGTAQIAASAGAIVRHEDRQGKGYVVQSMFGDIDADIYILVDGDDTYPATEVHQLIQPIVSKRADIVLGDRLSSTYFTENKRLFHNSGNRLVRFLINRLFGGNLNDILTGYRAFNRDFVKSFPISSGGFEIETEMAVHALDKKFRINEIPVEYRDRSVDNPSKLNTFSDGARVLRMVALLFRDYQPLKFFSAISIILVILGCSFLIPVLMEYHQTGLVERFPTLIVSCMVLLVAILMFCVGLILEVISRQNRLQYSHIRNLQNLIMRKDLDAP